MCTSLATAECRRSFNEIAKTIEHVAYLARMLEPVPDAFTVGFVAHDLGKRNAANTLLVRDTLRPTARAI